MLDRMGTSDAVTLPNMNTKSRVGSLRAVRTARLLRSAFEPPAYAYELSPSAGGRQSPVAKYVPHLEPQFIPGRSLITYVVSLLTIQLWRTSTCDPYSSTALNPVCSNLCAYMTTRNVLGKLLYLCILTDTKSTCTSRPSRALVRCRDEEHALVHPKIGQYQCADKLVREI